MACGTFCRDNLKGNTHKQVYALVCITVLVVVLNYLFVQPWERLPLDMIVLTQSTLLWLMGFMQVVEIVCHFSCSDRPRVPLLMSYYVLGVLFLTATIDGFIHEATS